ncbi:hypothetical protein CEXT_297931 [Caerostris extrusa]|uniref:Uncharacterized protein n=1 Tax=Caerostris extrusa TaxID=172846 RepID=A0AAV4TY42_CAEEX|nr:hypothetical protein CEXT_297931 [Caerostris extrusa]
MRKHFYYHKDPPAEEVSVQFVKNHYEDWQGCPIPFFTLSLTTPFLNIMPPLTTLFLRNHFSFSSVPCIFVCDRCGQDRHLGLCGKPGACRKEDAPPHPGPRSRGP